MSYREIFKANCLHFVKKQREYYSQLTKERFYQSVTAFEGHRKGYWQATIKIKGREHMGDGHSEQEAKDNLWEYLTSDIGII